MPKFLYTVFILLISFWYLFYSYIASNNPYDFNGDLIVSRVIVVLFILFLAISLTFSVPLYFYFHKKAPTFSNLRFIYRKALKWAAYFSFGAIFLLGLRAFNLDNYINTFLFFVLYFLMFAQLRGRR